MRGPLFPRRAVLALGAAAALASGACASAAPAKLEPLEVVTDKGRTRFMVEVVDNDATRARGLMYRTSLAPDRGMLFDFKTPRDAAFWMRNTYIPLDIVYIKADGRVLSIVRNARPKDETPLPSGGPVLGVLEIPGGRAAEIGLLPGDRVLHRIFPRD
ncbi:MAG: DUF192 domain-containing protein [Phenylobacterium sp.]|uniref:DUF192 domain-containing protein n=1 Tax=Phenylobacterium sp. TaxID=1871053 RepID=UPI00391D794A